MASFEGGTVSRENSKERANVPMEMSEMSRSQQVQTSSIQPPGASSTETSPQDVKNILQQSRHNENLNVVLSVAESAASTSTDGRRTPPIPSEARTQSPRPLIREVTGPAIGPAVDKPTPHSKEPETVGPVLYITLLLTTGARHPFKLDQKYLRKRSVEVEGDNPVNMSLYKLKELILRDWRDEWEAKPSSPDSIRLISMGKLLPDKSRLSDFGFKEGAAPMIVHMTIKPQELVDEEEANKNVRDRDVSVRTPRCRCMIM